MLRQWAVVVVGHPELLLLVVLVAVETQGQLLERKVYPGKVMQVEPQLPLLILGLAVGAEQVLLV